MANPLVRFLLGLAALAAPVALHAQASPSPYTSGMRYDAMGRVTGTISTDPDNIGSGHPFLATRTTYDGRGNAVKVESGTLSAWHSEAVAPANWGATFTIFSSMETTYNGRNQKLVEQSKGSDGIAYRVTQHSYDNHGRLECTAVRMNPAAFGSLPASACTLGTEGGFGPDRITRNIYDAASQLLQVRTAVGTSLESAEVTHSYTPNGKRKFVIDGNGNRAELRYDGLDRQARWVFPSTTRPSSFNDATPTTALSTAGALNEGDYEAYTYDANGHRLTLRKRDGSTLSYTYDNLNRITVKVVPERAGVAATHTRDVYYGYDLRGLQTYARFDGPSGEGVSVIYDGFGRKYRETQTMDGATRHFWSDYDKDGVRIQTIYPDGAFVDYFRDGVGRLYYARLNGTSPLFYPPYDAAGRVAVAYRLMTATGQWGWYDAYSAYSYDPVGRISALTTALAGSSYDSTKTFARNPAGQLTSRSESNDAYAWGGHVNVNRGYTTNGLNQYSAAGGASFTYDANGNLTSDGANTFLYDVENRLITRSGGGTNATLRYDPLGRLYEVDGSATGITRFLNDGDAMVAEYNSSGTMLRRYVHGPAEGTDDPLVWFEGPTVYDTARRYLYADERGSIVGVADGNGNVTAINSYDEYGIPAAGNQGRFQFTGQAWLAELGMYSYKARLYSPTLGRFMQIDPIGYEDQWNLYAYVGNDPVNQVDPDGKKGVGILFDFALEVGIQYGETGKVDIGRAVVETAKGALNPLRTAEKLRTAGQLVSRAAKRCCFVAGTLVDTEEGLRPIEDIAIGDRVWARDEKSGETALKEVTDLIRLHEREIWEVSVTGPSGESERFETTDDHPWSIAGQGWKRTDELTAGMAVVTRDGRGMVLTSVIETERTDATYNLTVADFETYFVGEQRVLVHNCPTEGVYKFKEGSGKYVGQSGNVEKRLGDHQRVGRLDSADSAEVTPVPGGKTAREVAEHRTIQQETGGVPAKQSDAVTNQRDPIGPKRQRLLDDK